jgi:hypothetical protein
MVEIVSVLIAFIPAVIIAVVALLLVKWFLKSAKLQQERELLFSQKKELLAHRLQAYERLTLYLERMMPESLVLREQQSGMSSHQFHTHLLKTIRKEFEHNLAMQIYLPSSTWETIRGTREELIKLINTCAAECSPVSPSIELGRLLLERAGGGTTFQIINALETLKKDIAKFD